MNSLNCIDVDRIKISKYPDILSERGDLYE